MALGDLPNIMPTSYNDYVFNETIETTAYRVVPRYDSAGRTVTHCDFSITVRWYIGGSEHGGSALDVQEMEQKLTRPNGVLKYTGRNFANEIVDGKGVRDIDYGPKPGELLLEPVGAGIVTRATWSVTFSIPTCDDRVFKGIREWNYTVAYQIDMHGNTTITTTGFLKIAANRANPKSTKIVESADAYLEKVVPGLRRGFRRLSQSHDLSESKAKLSYTVVDEQIGQNAPGEGLTHAKASEAITNEQPGKMVAWVHSLDGTYTVASGRPVKAAWAAFWATVKDRLALTKATIPAAALVPVQFTAEDTDLYSQNQTVHLRFVYRVVNATLQQALASMGLWRPVPNSTWTLWMGSVADVFGPRGSAKIVWSLNDDKIIDLCKSDVPPKAATIVAPGGIAGGAGGAGVAGGIGGAILGGLAAIPPGLFPPPQAQKSWLHFEQYAQVVVDTGRVLSKMLPSDPLTIETPSGGTWDALTGQFPGHSLGAIPTVSQSRSRSLGDDTVIHQRVKPTVHVYLSGRAIRYGYGIPQPQLVSVNGQQAVLMDTGAKDEGFVSGIVGNAFYPICGARWRYHYVVPGLNSLDTLPNPEFGQV